MRYAALILTFITFTFSTSACADQREVPQNQQSVQLSFAPLVKKVAPAVVNIYTKRTVQTGFRSPFMSDPFFNEFFGRGLFGGRMRKQVESALGSGVIVTKEGLVVTNAHVVRGAEEITIAMADGTEYPAALVISDEASDLALLQLDATREEFPFVRLKPSETLEVGDLVVAIGNPFGMGQTVTSGIVSAQGRSSLDINDFNFFIQTDAAINPGNSGGPLVALDGGVVGINTAIYSRSGGSMGLGFAVPSEMVASVIAAAVNGQTGDKGIIRPWLGVQAQDVTTEIGQSLGLARPTGALISDVHTVSPLAKAGIKVGDVVIAVNGTEIRNAAEMKFRMATVPIGSSANVTYLREGARMTVKVNAIAPPDIPERSAMTIAGETIFQGLVVANLNPAVSVELGLKTEEQGVVVLSVPRRSYAMRVFAEGDILMRINGTEIKKPSDVQRALEGHQGGLEVVLKRGGRVSQMILR